MRVSRERGERGEIFLFLFDVVMPVTGKTKEQHLTNPISRSLSSRMQQEIKMLQVVAFFFCFLFCFVFFFFAFSVSEFNQVKINYNGRRWKKRHQNTKIPRQCYIDVIDVAKKVFQEMFNFNPNPTSSHQCFRDIKKSFLLTAGTPCPVHIFWYSSVIRLIAWLRNSKKRLRHGLHCALFMLAKPSVDGAVLLVAGDEGSILIG